MYNPIHHIAVGRVRNPARFGLDGGDIVARMVRKQLYLDEETDRRLAERAALLGVSQAKLVRVAVDRYLEGGAQSAHVRAWQQLRQAIDQIVEQGDVPGTGRTWKREDLYDR